jgi:hypothetical protein
MVTIELACGIRKDACSASSCGTSVTRKAHELELGVSVRVLSDFPDNILETLISTPVILMNQITNG